MKTYKKMMLILMFVFGLNVGFPNYSGNYSSNNKYVASTYVKKVIKKPTFDVNKAIYSLKTEKYYLKGDLKTLDSLTYNLLDEFIDDSLYAEYELPKKELISCIQSLSMFESGRVTRKGSMPFKSSLFVESNNPFGIKHMRDSSHIAWTTEIIDGERHRKYLKFQYYPTMDDAIDDLMRILNLKRYKNLHIAKTKKEFFYYLRKAGYHTAGYSYSHSLTQYAVKLYDISNEEIKV